MSGSSGEVLRGPRTLRSRRFSERKACSKEVLWLISSLTSSLIALPSAVTGGPEALSISSGSSGDSASDIACCSIGSASAGEVAGSSAADTRCSYRTRSRSTRPMSMA
jgi:hypothetical protein